MNKERRRHARVSLGVEVDVTSSSNFFVGRTRDLSTGGLFVETDVPVPIGMSVSLELLLDGRKHSLVAEVVWALDAPDGSTVGVGVRFTELASRTRSAIVAFLDRRAPVEFEIFDPEPVLPEPGPEQVECAPLGNGRPPPLPGVLPPPFPS